MCPGLQMECLTTWHQGSKIFLIARLLGRNSDIANCFVRMLILPPCSQVGLQRPMPRPPASHLHAYPLTNNLLCSASAIAINQGLK